MSNETGRSDTTRADQERRGMSEESREHKKVDTPKAGGSKRLWTLLIGLGLIAMLAGGVVYLVGMGGGDSVNPAAESDGQLSGQGSEAAGAEIEHPSLGDADAPVVMIEYSDFQCPYCGKFARETEPELIEKYVEAGTLRIEWRDFPYFGQESVNAALAARAAQEQGKFWEYHGVLYDNQKSMNSGAFSDENLSKFAREVGLDVEKFEADAKSGKYEAAVNKDFQEGQSKGVTGTPTFFINGEALVGAQPAEVFEKAIEKAAKEADDG